MTKTSWGEEENQYRLGKQAYKKDSATSLTTLDEVFSFSLIQLKIEISLTYCKNKASLLDIIVN